MSNVVKLPPSGVPSYSDLEREGEATEAADDLRNAPEIDLETVRDRARAVNGALSTLDVCPVTGAQFWDIFGKEPARGVYMEWARKSLAMLQDIVAEGERRG